MRNSSAEPRFFLLLLIVLCLAGCTGTGYRVEVDRSEKSRHLKGHQRPYSVNGERYVPLRDHAGFVEEGVASWYGPDFHGKSTSCGEIYDMNAMTSAHKILPMGVHVRVTNLRNHRSVVVRVNDRGPFVKNRVIDLSHAAAKALDVVASGTAPVRVEALGFREGETAAVGIGPFTVQIAAFKDPENAKRFLVQTRLKYGEASLQQGWVNGVLFYRVRAGRYADIPAAEAARIRMEEDGAAAAFVVALN